MLLAATAAFVALEDDQVVQEESVVTADPTPVPTPSPQPSAEATATASPVATAPVSSESEIQGELEAQGVANTEVSSAPLVDSTYVPSFVATGDRSQYDADVSSPLAPPTPTAAPAPVAAPTTAPTPTPEPTKAPKPDADNGDAGNSDNGNSGDEGNSDENPDTSQDGGDDGNQGGGGPTAEQWAALRACESGGNYQILSPGGAYRGAYQFSQATWDSTAASANPSLVGVDPIDASPAQQDAMAFALYAMRGASPWPHCGRYLR